MLSDDDLNQLEEWLGHPALEGRALALDALQGFIAAVVTSPDPIDDEEWIDVALDGPPGMPDADANVGLLRLLRAMRDDVQTELASGEGLTMQVYADPDDPDQHDLGPWCAGYMEGVAISPTPWDEVGDPDEIDELLFPMMVVGDALDDEQKQAIGDKELERFERELPDEVANAAVHLYRYFHVLRNIPEPARRDGPKVGRNDPCPCGSGKKYKACHGAG
jgi:uncharacterized protein